MYVLPQRHTNYDWSVCRRWHAMKMFLNRRREREREMREWELMRWRRRQRKRWVFRCLVYVDVRRTWFGRVRRIRLSAAAAAAAFPICILSNRNQPMVLCGSACVCVSCSIDFPQRNYFPRHADMPDTLLLLLVGAFTAYAFSGCLFFYSWTNRSQRAQEAKGQMWRRKFCASHEPITSNFRYRTEQKLCELLFATCLVAWIEQRHLLPLSPVDSLSCARVWFEESAVER